MDTEYIREYVRVASEGSMTKAAAQLNISQPGLSKHMVALEKCVGGELLQRSSTGVTPTPLGRAFFEKAYDILRVYDGAIDYMGKMCDSKPLHLRVNALSDCALSDDLLSSPTIVRIRQTPQCPWRSMCSTGPSSTWEPLGSGTGVRSTGSASPRGGARGSLQEPGKTRRDLEKRKGGAVRVARRPLLTYLL